MSSCRETEDTRNRRARRPRGKVVGSQSRKLRQKSILQHSEACPLDEAVSYSYSACRLAAQWVLFFRTSSRTASAKSLIEPILFWQREPLPYAWAGRSLPTLPSSLPHRGPYTAVLGGATNTRTATSRCDHRIQHEPQTLRNPVA